MMISRSWQLMICSLIIAGISGMAFCADNVPVQARSLHVPYSIPLKDITLEGYLVSSDNTSYASTVIIILHGWFSEDVNGARAYLSYANRLASAGFTAIT
ncbi:MAG: hypothetical protein KJO03_00635, partial [Gammaproteobacteria bacterium]|nr:hypothetical protein [Gammaproteobacteria bacterium]